MLWFVPNPFHLVEFSPWPIYSSLGALFMLSGLATKDPLLFMLGLTLTTLTSYQWWRDVIRESSYQGYHNTVVVLGLRMGVILFILSEACLFFSFFWAFFHSSLAPTIELGNIWPPLGINPLSPWGVPLLNTVVLLSSGVSVTWAHHSLIVGNKFGTSLGLMITVTLGTYFTYLQVNEYMETSFSISDSVYGAVFFVFTGFHGVHVLVGTTFLLICLMRTMFNHFNSGHHLGFEAAAWYWHFVDVVWLFLFILIYWWGG